MKMNKTIKILVGILTALLILMPIFIMAGVVTLVFVSSAASEATHSANTDMASILFLIAFFGFMVFVYLYQFLHFALQILYIILIIKNKTLSETYQILLVLGIFFLSGITMPVYYLACMWQDTPSEISGLSATA
jgi:uncharacterized membrane protein YjgN (DUF898 family)